MKTKLIIIVSVFISLQSCTKVEIVALHNKISNETIYLKHITGVDYELNAISLSKSPKVNENTDYQSEFDCFLYKLEKDTLYISFGWDERDFIKGKFKTKIKYLKFSNFKDEDYFYNNYRKPGFEVFPISRDYIIENLY